IRKSPTIARNNHARQVLQIDLVTDSHAGWYHTKSVEGLLGPVEQGVTFTVPPVFPIEVGSIGVWTSETINLHGVVDDQVDRDKGINLLRVASRASDSTSH